MTDHGSTPLDSNFDFKFIKDHFPFNLYPFAAYFYMQRYSRDYFM